MITEHVFNTNEEWLEFRRNGLGGSDVSAMYGRSKYSTRENLIESKINAPTFSENAITKMGHIMEPVIYEQFIKQDFKESKQMDNIGYKNDKYPRLQASLDGRGIHKKDDFESIIEIKFVNMMGHTKWKGTRMDYPVMKDNFIDFTYDGKQERYYLPELYWMQCQHYMAVLEIKKTYLYAFFQHMADVKVFEIDFDPNFAYRLNIDSINLFDEIEAKRGNDTK